MLAKQIEEVSSDHEHDDNAHPASEELLGDHADDVMLDASQEDEQVQDNCEAEGDVVDIDIPCKQIHENTSDLDNDKVQAKVMIKEGPKNKVPTPDKSFEKNTTQDKINNPSLADNLIKTITDYEIQLAGLSLDDPMRVAYQGIVDSLKAQLKNLSSKHEKPKKDTTKSVTDTNLRGTKASFNSSKQSSGAGGKFDRKKVSHESDKKSQIIELSSSDFSSDEVC